MHRLLRLPAALVLWMLAASLLPAIDSEGIDAALEEAQRAAGVEPAGRSTDAEFLRRLSLDVRGRVPSVEETIAFLKDTSPHKRGDLVEAYLASEERGEHWAAYWDKVLLGTLEQPQNPEAQYVVKGRWRAWAAEQFNANLPWDEFMRETITARGRTDDVPEALPIARWQRAPESLAGTMSRAFLGVQIQCAQCHDHKTNPDLTQQKFWEFTAFFGNTRSVPVVNTGGGAMKPRYAVEVADMGPRWAMPVPGTDPPREAEPRYLDGTPARQRVVDAAGNPVSRRELVEHYRTLRQMREEGRRSGEAGSIEMATEMMQRYRSLPEVRDTRRDQLADLILDRDARQFAGNLVNRTWARYFGRGIVDPVDEWADGAEPSHPQLLDALVDDFIASGHDIRALERKILNTRAYQRSSRPTDSSVHSPEHFAHAAIRPLTPDQLLASLVEVTRSEPSRSAGEKERLDRLQLRYAGQFVHVFGNDEMEWASTFEPSIPRALFLMNDDTINKALRGDGDKGLIPRIVQTTDDPADQARYLYLAVLSREASPEERALLAADIRAASAKSAREHRLLLEDAAWALLNSTEFLTSH